MLHAVVPRLTIFLRKSYRLFEGHRELGFNFDSIAVGLLHATTHYLRLNVVAPRFAPGRQANLHPLSLNPSLPRPITS